MSADFELSPACQCAHHSEVRRLEAIIEQQRHDIEVWRLWAREHACREPNPRDLNGRPS